MTKKLALFVSFPIILKKIRLGMKLITMLLLIGTIQLSAAGGISSSDDLQKIVVSGRVTDNTGSGLPGVNVVERGTVNGAITNVDGSYTLTVASSASVLSFSFVGYTSQDVTVGTQTTINVALAETVSTLEEIVVVGYTTQVRKNLSGSISTVSTMQVCSTSSFSNVTFQGQASGVTVSSANRPGGDAIIRIRGVGTINDPNPLYVIDGVPSDPVIISVQTILNQSRSLRMLLRLQFTGQGVQTVLLSSPPNAAVQVKAQH